jgi:hypothetical protein
LWLTERKLKLLLMVVVMDVAVAAPSSESERSSSSAEMFVEAVDETWSGRSLVPEKTSPATYALGPRTSPSHASRVATYVVRPDMGTTAPRLAQPR